VTVGLARSAAAVRGGSRRVISANDRINLAFIGQCAEGSGLSRDFGRIAEQTKTCQIVAVCDVYRKRLEAAKAKHKCHGYLDYREVISRKDVDAVVIATPDHWHARISLEAMDSGKDVYVEKAMCHSIEEARRMVETVKETKRVLQVGSQTTSADQWHKAKKAISDGMIGQLIISQGSYHRNSTRGEWNYPIDPAAGPDASGENYTDWKMWLGPAPSAPMMPIASFVSASIGIIPAASPPTSSITSSRR
jgi:predicted dehydrogenase